MDTNKVPETNPRDNENLQDTPRMAIKTPPPRECVTGKGDAAKRYLSLRVSRKLLRVIERYQGGFWPSMDDAVEGLLWEALAERESTLKNMLKRQPCRIGGRNPVL